MVWIGNETVCLIHIQTFTGHQEEDLRATSSLGEPLAGKKSDKYHIHLYILGKG